MTIRVLIPKPGMGITEATIVKWLKAEGDQVTQGEPIVELEYAKAVEELSAPASGTLTKILLQEGETAPVRTPIAEIK